jgi:hypothetical protein
MDRAAKVLNYAPRVSVKAGLAQLWTWYCANPGAVMAAAGS